MKPYCFQFILLFLLFSFGNQVIAQVTDPELKQRFKTRSIEKENEGLAEPFKGITVDGNVSEGLFELKSTGVSTEPMRKAAISFLESLDDQQQEKTKFPIHDDEWRKWMNQDFYVRQGVNFVEMTEKQRAAAFDLMSASLSVKGLKLSKDIMKLNYTLAEIRDDFQRYGEWLYWITMMGEPSETEP
jgi:hypothetical protein